MADYSSFIALANRLISQKGMEMTFRHLRQSGQVDPATGKRQLDVTETRFMGAITRPTKDETAQGHFQNVTQVVLAPGDALKNPSIADRLRFLGHDWEISEILKVAPAGVPVLYKFGIRDAGLA